MYDYHTLLHDMSPELRKEVAMKTQTEWVSKLKFLHGKAVQADPMKPLLKAHPTNLFDAKM